MDLHQKWPHRWLNSKAEARRSGIAGTGVYAKEPIHTGEIVGVLGGVIVHHSQIAEYRQVMTQVGIQVDDDFFIVPTTRQELETFGVFNHSCQPNIGFSSSISFIAMKDIDVGEELVFDYAFCETAFPSFPCACGTATCRHTVTENDWKDITIQKKYLSYFSPYLKKKIAVD